MSVPVLAPGGHRPGTAEHPHDPATARIAPLQHVRRRVADFDHLMDTLNIQLAMA